MVPVPLLLLLVVVTGALSSAFVTILNDIIDRSTIFLWNFCTNAAALIVFSNITVARFVSEFNLTRSTFPICFAIFSSCFCVVEAERLSTTTIRLFGGLSFFT
uniref:Secreted protein n=1 Tax=Panstrongylus lignarius TaxID=156445 RepID=A0A224XQL6_9HEMI